MSKFVLFGRSNFFHAGDGAQSAGKTKPKPKNNPVTAEDIQALRDVLAPQSDMLASQQQQIQELKQELEKRDLLYAS
jgi:hypothetical protein